MDVTEETFATAVLERSKQVPVVVDFWAEWCAPCRQLGPVLERAVAQRAGKIELVKVDTDSNQQLAQALQIQSIPAVKAFKEGRIASEFVGVQPPEVIERFLDELLPSEAEGLVAQGDEASLRRAIELEPGRADAAVPLAKLLYARGETDEAVAILENVSGSFAAEGLLARIGLERSGTPDLSDAFTALDSGASERGLDLLIDAIPSADGAKDEIRKVVVGVLDELGAENEIARAARRRLATALY
ncbi:MAG TPA: tetratricopeptide repeat protein [Solirubrobacteraceae bacterium]|jgi:putative thioredoxin|nr:tetratricopeptide repeat protein [Solirubrobacteraceae bacterium]